MKKALILFIAFVSAFLYACSGGVGDSPSSSGGGTSGTAGSMARFAIVGNVLYTVTTQTLNLFDIADAQNPVPRGVKSIGFNIETIYPYKNYLFLGSQSGMQIFDNSNPLLPTWVSTYSHIMSCDPVVVQGQYAYVTLRTASACMRGVNQLEIIDIADPKSPKLVNIINMINPHGLGIDGDKLFVCEGASGLKVFDISTPTSPLLQLTLNSVDSYDVIPNSNVLIVTGKGGIFQYDYSKKGELSLLSKITVE
jgi:hypothetical protein